MKITKRQTEIIEAMREWPVENIYLPGGDMRNFITNRKRIGKMIVEEYMLRRLKDIGIIEMEQDNRIDLITYVLKDEWK